MTTAFYHSHCFVPLMDSHHERFSSFSDVAVTIDGRSLVYTMYLMNVVFQPVIDAMNSAHYVLFSYILVPNKMKPKTNPIYCSHIIHDSPSHYLISLTFPDPYSLTILDPSSPTTTLSLIPAWLSTVFADTVFPFLIHLTANEQTISSPLRATQITNLIANSHDCE